MTEHDERREGDDPRPKVRVVDKRRFREGSEGAVAAPSEEPSAEPSVEAAEPDELVLARGEAAEYRDHLQRLQAEFDNYRKRVLKEQTRAVELASQPAMLRLLEVLDEFDLALMAAERSPDFEQFRRGVELVYAKLVESLRTEGLERIEAEGQVFDPVQHEALMQSGGPDGEPYVAEVFRPGYRLKGSVLRPASVRIERR
ncbi:MAG TPA: nucleotide exchange factor GrpE [Actinomycetota bacterium]|nr:nucleotide exchange factor GrpE [Actinomycetota bacterium]